MMGHINNLVVEMVRDHLGNEGVGSLFAAAGLEERCYQPEVIYPEEEFQALFRGAQHVFDVDSDAAEKAFSSYFMEVSPKQFPAIFRQAGNARGLLERFPTIHRNFPAAAQQDYQEKVFVTESTSDHIVIEYDSPNRLCITLRTIAGIVLEYYGERGTVTETACQKEGAPRCRVVVAFDGRGQD